MANGEHKHTTKRICCTFPSSYPIKSKVPYSAPFLFLIIPAQSYRQTDRHNLYSTKSNLGFTRQWTK
jgi:hypothetical protein